MLYYRYHDEYHSIFPMGDITALIPDDEADVCVLEEPEHLNWLVKQVLSEHTICLSIIATDLLNRIGIELHLPQKRGWKSLSTCLA